MHTEAEVSLSTDLNAAEAVPYFLWDDPMTMAEFRQRLQTASPTEQTRLLAKLLREARDTDVWRFVSPAEVWRRSPRVGAAIGSPPRLLGISLEPMAESGAAWLSTN